MTDGPTPDAPVPLADILAEFSMQDQSDIRAHADQLILESRTLAEFRRGVGMTQAELAEALETSQAYVAKLEQRSATDMQVSTIARVAAALGGAVKVVVSLPGRPDTTLALPVPTGGRKAARVRSKAGAVPKGRRTSA